MASTSSLAISQALLGRAISHNGSDKCVSLPAFSGLKSTPPRSTFSRRRSASTNSHSLRPLVRAAAVETTTDSSLVDKSVNTIRFLAIDAVEKAKSGHPGLPMGCAPMSHILYDEVMRYNPKNPHWFNRDRFVLSAGHGCMLQYALLHLAGYDSVREEDLKSFRQWGSKTPGHPENFETPGVEVTTGPLGQGIANAVGLALAEKHLAARFNKPDNEIVDHCTYSILGDGCQMEGISNEVCSLAGHWGLGKLIAFYNDNHISIDGDTEIALTESVDKRFEALGWYCEVSSVTNCDEDPETSSVKETSGMSKGTSAASPCSCSKNESSNPATGLRSLRSPDQFLKRHISTANFRRSPLGAESSVIVTPERYSIADSRDSTLEAESPLNKSVNSHALKRRKFTSSPVIDLEEEDSNAPSTRPADHTSFTRRIEFGFGSTESRSQNDNIYAFPETDQRVMRISCSLCRSPLGHPESHSYLRCSLTSLSKTYLLSLLKETSGTGSAEMPTSVSVVMTYCSLVNQRLCISSEGSKGIWCEQDGCVFNTIFCPFCSIPNTCLGVQVMATDSSNVQFLRKILFFADQVYVTEDAASKETASKQKLRVVPKRNLPTSKNA